VTKAPTNVLVCCAHCTVRNQHSICALVNAGVQQEVKFQGNFFSKFQDILRSQKVENHYVFCTTNES